MQLHTRSNIFLYKTFINHRVNDVESPLADIMTRENNKLNVENTFKFPLPESMIMSKTLKNIGQKCFFAYENGWLRYNRLFSKL